MYLIKDEKQRRIMTAAVDVFSEKGYTYSTIEDIVKKSGLLEEEVYTNFQNKQDIFEHVLIYILKRYLELLKEATEDKTGAREKFVTIFDFNDNFEYREILLLQEALNGYNNVSESFKPDLIQAHKDVFNFLISIIREGQEEGSINRDINKKALSLFFISLITGINNKNKIFSINTYIDNREIVDMIFDGIS